MKHRPVVEDGPELSEGTSRGSHRGPEKFVRGGVVMTGLAIGTAGLALKDRQLELVARGNGDRLPNNPLPSSRRLFKKNWEMVAGGSRSTEPKVTQS